ncbi:MAG: Fur family transcriptional regulator [Candidatus Doudnabacteria bacterium]|nr:Fur family transcriptional regulator [Candidatus Doudnabacteria bacterium]
MNKPCNQHIAESKEQLKAGSLKITSARLTLLDILKHAKKPLSIKEISLRLGEVDLVTLYRNVESLQNLGIVKQINLKDRQAYYELSGGEHHHHLICTNCGKLEDVQVEEIKLNKTFLKNHGFAKVTDHSLEFFGICKNCDR